MSHQALARGAGAGGEGCAFLLHLGDWAGPGAPTIMKRKRLPTTRESWKVMEGLGGVSAEEGDLLLH